MRILILIHYTIHCTVHARCNQGAHIADMKQTWNISTRDMQPETNLEVLYPWFPLTKHRKHDDSHDRSDTYSWTKCGIQWIIPLTLLFITWVMMPAVLLSEVRRTSSCLLTAREEDAGPRWTMQGNHCQCTVVSGSDGSRPWYCSQRDFLVNWLIHHPWFNNVCFVSTIQARNLEPDIDMSIAILRDKVILYSRKTYLVLCVGGRSKYEI